MMGTCVIINKVMTMPSDNIHAKLTPICQHLTLVWPSKHAG